MKKTLLVLSLLFILTLTLNGCGGDSSKTNVSDSNTDKQETQVVTKVKVPLKKGTVAVENTKTNENTAVESELAGNIANIAEGNLSGGNPAQRIIDRRLVGVNASENNVAGNNLGGSTSAGSTSTEITPAGKTTGGSTSGGSFSGGSTSGGSTSGGTTSGGTTPSGNTPVESGFVLIEEEISVLDTNTLEKEITNFDSYEKSSLTSLGISCSVENAEIMAMLKTIESKGIYEKTFQKTTNTRITVYRTSNPNKLDTDTFNIMFEGCTIAGKTLNLKAYESYLLWNYDQCSAGNAPEEDQEGFFAWKKCSNHENKVELFLTD